MFAYANFAVSDPIHIMFVGKGRPVILYWGYYAYAEERSFPAYGHCKS